MDATIKLYCPLCRSELCVTDAVRPHLIGEHKRSAAEAAELIARFDIGKPIPEPGRSRTCISERRNPGAIDDQVMRRRRRTGKCG